MPQETSFSLTKVEFDPESFVWRGTFEAVAPGLYSTSIRVFCHDTKTSSDVGDTTPDLSIEDASKRLRDAAAQALQALLRAAGDPE